MRQKRFAPYIKSISEKKKSRIVLALDPDPIKIDSNDIVNYLTSLLDMLNEHIIGIKMNMHVLLPLGREEINTITSLAHKYDVATIADIKLNDIPNTNQVAIYNLASMNFDAVIVNPFIGYHALYDTLDYARLKEIGILTLVFMSHKGSEETFGLKVDDKRLYEIFLEWSLNLDVDGIIVGATYPDIIRHCYSLAKDRVPIYSPGVITQGGDPSLAIKYGVEYLIVGRNIVDADDPVKAVIELNRLINK